jgi:hypothetical protein
VTVNQIRKLPREIELLQKAAAYLEKCTDLDEVKDIRDKAEALRLYSAQQKDGLAAQNAAGIIKIRAEWRGGEIGRDMEKARGKRTDKPTNNVLVSSKKEALDKAGISEMTMSRWEAIAAIPKKQLEEEIERTVEANREVTSTALVKIGRSIQKAQDRAIQAAEARESLVDDDDLGVRLGDFRDIADTLPHAGTDLIFTDPPYNRDSLLLYEDLARVGARILKPGGSLITYFGQYQIRDVIDLMDIPPLRLWWMLCCRHGGTMARMTEYGVIVEYKPMLWLVHGTRGDKTEFVKDLVESTRQKDVHDWQLGLEEATYYIDKLTLPGGFIFDPFCGGGTTAVACRRLGRRYQTCDTDETAVLNARQRLADEGRTT